jgi:hypothetical protein
MLSNPINFDAMEFLERKCYVLNNPYRLNPIYRMSTVLEALSVAMGERVIEAEFKALIERNNVA